MDWLTFLSKVIDSIAWPIVIVIVLWVFRGSLSDVIKRLSNLSYKNFSMDFQKELDEIIEVAGDSEEEEEANENSANIGHDDDEMGRPMFSRQQAPREEIEEVALISGRASIPLVWSTVERAVEQTYFEKYGEAGGKVAPIRMLEKLKTDRVLDKETFYALKRLRQMRNEAVHGKYVNLSTREALEYSKLAKRMINRLKNSL